MRWGKLGVSILLGVLGCVSLGTTASADDFWDEDYSCGIVTYHTIFDQAQYCPESEYYETIYDCYMPFPELKYAKFAGWYDNPEGLGSQYLYYTSMRGDMDMYAKWWYNPRPIKYSMNYGTNHPDNPTTLNNNFSGFEADLLEPTRTGYLFDGWEISMGGDESYVVKDETGYHLEATSAFREIVEGNGREGYPTVIRVSARWVKDPDYVPPVPTYTYKYRHVIDGELDPENSDMRIKIPYEDGRYPTYQQGDTIALPTLSYPGYTFEGWYVSRLCLTPTTGIKPTDSGNKSFYAKWSANVHEVTCVLANGARHPADDQMWLAEEVQPITGRLTGVPAVVCANPAYTFGGWYSTPDCKGYRVYSMYPSADETYTLYAKWTKSGYTIQYDLQGGVNDEENPAGVSKLDLQKGDVLIRPATKKGFYFNGWYYDKDCTKPLEATVGGYRLQPTKDVTLYADWQLKFADVTVPWHIGAVSYVVERDLMNGVSEFSFDPNGALTRGMVATILWNMAGRPAVTMTDKPFPDVETGKYYSLAVAWAKNTGVFKGFKDGSFGPTKNITRQDFAVAMSNFAAYKKMDRTVQDPTAYMACSDYKQVAGYAVPAIRWAYERKIMGSGQTLAPTRNISRAEAAATIQKYYLAYQ